ncbi:transposase, partial [uncultured Mycobacterium sp.]|uniref:IS110 family transposase n=1 Tax=uncultured Mycobacterium sp. TaxID=171292 RepID=UPI0035C99E95
MKKRITDDPAGFAELVELLTTAGDSGEHPVPVAIETPRGLLVAALRATARPVYAINPLTVARYRERHSVARSKSDRADAMTVAHILRVDAHLHRRLTADSELCQSICGAGPRASGRDLAAHQGPQRIAVVVARVLPHLPGHLHRAVRARDCQPRGPHRARDHPHSSRCGKPVGES